MHRLQSTSFLPSSPSFSRDIIGGDLPQFSYSGKFQLLFLSPSDLQPDASSRNIAAGSGIMCRRRTNPLVGKSCHLQIANVDYLLLIQDIHILVHD